MEAVLAWLQRWYQSQCDGQWEHSYGVRIDTLDNPGWSVEIDLTGTTLQSGSMQPVVRQGGADDWIRCEVKDRKFIGHGDPTKLLEILTAFQEWAERYSN
jgi:hypothetical protein